MNIEAIRIILGLIISVGGIVLSIRYLQVHPFFSLLGASVIFGVIAGMPMIEIVTSLQSGFGSLMHHIGIVVVLGCVLGMMLEKSAAMESLSYGILHLFGEKRSLFALVFIGVLVGIPVFCDSGFIILSRLIPALAAKTGQNPTALALALSGGLYTTHTLVPPTPGPLAAATNVGVGGSLGWVMMMGLLITIPVMMVTYGYARFVGKSVAIVQKVTEPTTIHLPLWKASAPLVVPIALIAIASFIETSEESTFLTTSVKVIGIPVVALFIGIVLAAVLSIDLKAKWPEWITEALKDAGLILLIVGAGGSFGAVIKASGLERQITAMSSSMEVSPVMLLVVAWVLGAVLKTAQGSTTSAMIVTSSLVAPLAAALHLSLQQLTLVTMAIGGGAMVVSHANDAYFWVVSKFGGMSTSEMFRHFPVLTFLQGITVLLTTLILSLLL